MKKEIEITEEDNEAARLYAGIEKYKLGSVERYIAGGMYNAFIAGVEYARNPKPKEVKKLFVWGESND